MVGPPSYQTDPYRDTKSEGTLVEDTNMPTPWEGEIHELRDRLENSHPTRPRGYGPSDEYLRQLRGEACEYRSEPPRKPNKVYAVLCCGSPFGVVAWVIALVGLAVAIGLLLTKALKPDAFSSSNSTYISEGAASGTTVTVTASTPSISVSTLTTSTLSTETETTVSTSTQTTVSTDSTTSTVTYTPPTTATETRTATQTTTSLNTFTPPEPKTVTSIGTPSTKSITVPTTTSFGTTKTATETTFIMPTAVPKDTSSGGDDDDDEDTKNSDYGDQSDDDDGDGDDDDSDDSDSTSKGDSQKRMTFPNETPLQSMAPMIVTAMGNSKSLLASAFASAISWCVVHPATDRDDEASSFCGTFQGGSETQPTPTKAARKRNINFFANAAPLTETGQTSAANAERSSSMSTVTKLKRADEFPMTITFEALNGLTTATISDVTTIQISLHDGTGTKHQATAPIETTALPTSTTAPRVRRRKISEPQVGTCTLFSGNVDCVASKAWCVLFLLMIGIAVGGILTLSLGFLIRWWWRSRKAKGEEKSKAEKGRGRERSRRGR